MAKVLLKSVALILLSAPALGESVQYQGGDAYTIRMPEDWKEIPEGLVDEYEEAFAGATGREHVFDYGYQLKGKECRFEYPFVLVDVKLSGRVSGAELENYEPIGDGFGKAIENTDNAFGAFLSGVSQGEPVYDEENRLLWSKTSVDVSGERQIKGVVAEKLTEYGRIHFMGYATDRYFDQYWPVYKKMIYSISVPEPDRYKPGPAVMPDHD